MSQKIQRILSSLITEEITEEKISEYEVIILPEDYSGKESAGQVYDAQDAITLSKMLKNKDVKCANSYDLQLNVPTKERRSNDIWLGDIYVVSSFVLPTVVNVISSLITNAITERKNRKDSRSPAADVHVELTINKPTGNIQFRYDGDPASLQQVLHALNQDPNTQIVANDGEGSGN